MIKKLVLVLFSSFLLACHSYADKDGNNEKFDVKQTITFSYEDHLKERLIAYEFFWKDEKKYMPWIKFEMIGVGLADINDNGEKEIFAYINGEGLCPRTGCSFAIFKKQNDVYVPLTWSGGVKSVGVHGSPRFLYSKHNGYYDLVFSDLKKSRYNDERIHVWKWDGNQYR